MMIPAKYENGIFRPLEEVKLTEALGRPRATLDSFTYDGTEWASMKHC
jgi:hypothetical protein